MNLAIIGVTGLVGRMVLNILQKKNINITKLWPVASSKSVGTTITYRGKKQAIITIEEVIEQNIDVIIFAAAASLSLKWIPHFIQKKIIVIDNSSAWRMYENCLLIVPEVNGHLINKYSTLISNPNCSVIPLVIVLHAIQGINTIKSVIVSTYQSVTGSGQKGLDQLIAERKGEKTKKAYPYPIDLNLIPHIDTFLDNGYTKEEMKVINETKKILLHKTLEITSTAVRVPTIGGHALAVTITFEHTFQLENIKKTLKNTPGIIVHNKNTHPTYPMPWSVEGKDEVFVGRIRKAFDQENALHVWIVADNLRKGAATNAIQILQIVKKLLN